MRRRRARAAAGRRVVKHGIAAIDVKVDTSGHVLVDAARRHAHVDTHGHDHPMLEPRDHATHAGRTSHAHPRRRARRQDDARHDARAQADSHAHTHYGDIRADRPRADRGHAPAGARHLRPARPRRGQAARLDRRARRVPRGRRDRFDRRRRRHRSCARLALARERDVRRGRDGPRHADMRARRVAGARAGGARGAARGRRRDGRWRPAARAVHADGRRDPRVDRHARGPPRRRASPSRSAGARATPSSPTARTCSA